MGKVRWNIRGYVKALGMVFALMVGGIFILAIIKMVNEPEESSSSEEFLPLTKNGEFSILLSDIAPFEIWRGKKLAAGRGEFQGQSFFWLAASVERVQGSGVRLVDIVLSEPVQFAGSALEIGKEKWPAGVFWGVRTLIETPVLVSGNEVVDKNKVQSILSKIKEGAAVNLVEIRS